MKMHLSFSIGIYNFTRNKIEHSFLRQYSYSILLRLHHRLGSVSGEICKLLYDCCHTLAMVKIVGFPANIGLESLAIVRSSLNLDKPKNYLLRAQLIVLNLYFTN